MSDFLWILGLVTAAAMVAIGIKALVDFGANERGDPRLRLAAFLAIIPAFAAGVWLLATVFVPSPPRPAEQVVRIVIEDRR